MLKTRSIEPVYKTAESSNIYSGVAERDEYPAFVSKWCSILNDSSANEEVHSIDELNLLFNNKVLIISPFGYCEAVESRSENEIDHLVHGKYIFSLIRFKYNKQAFKDEFNAMSGVLEFTKRGYICIYNNINIDGSMMQVYLPPELTDNQKNTMRKYMEFLNARDYFYDQETLIVSIRIGGIKLDTGNNGKSRFGYYDIQEHFNDGRTKLLSEIEFEAKNR